MKNFKLLSIMVVAVFLLAGCKNTDSSTVIQNKSQSEITKAESSKLDTSSTKSTTYDKAEIEKKLKESKNITEDSIKQMKWSPDGKELIYYTEDEEHNCSLYLWKVGEEQPKNINFDSVLGLAFGWSPNSEYVLVDYGTSVVRGMTLINANGDIEPLTFSTASIAYSKMTLEQFWSSDSSKIAVAKYNSQIDAFPECELSGVFDIAVYDVKSKTEKTILKSTTAEYYTIEKWVDNDTIRCNKYALKNNGKGSIDQLGSIVEQKDLKIG